MINFTWYYIGNVSAVNFVQHSTLMFSPLEILCYMHHFGKQNMPLITNTCVHFFSMSSDANKISNSLIYWQFDWNVFGRFFKLSFFLGFHIGSPFFVFKITFPSALLSFEVKMTMGSTLIMGWSQFEGFLFYFIFFLFEYFKILLGVT